jgi:hypothetical protein
LGEQKPIDSGAEQLLAADNNDRKIAVEVKSFIRESRIADLEQALGQYTLYIMSGRLTMIKLLPPATNRNESNH